MLPPIAQVYTHRQPACALQHVYRKRVAINVSQCAESTCVTMWIREWSRSSQIASRMAVTPLRSNQALRFTPGRLLRSTRAVSSWPCSLLACSWVRATCTTDTLLCVTSSTCQTHTAVVGITCHKLTAVLISFALDQCSLLSHTCRHSTASHLVVTEAG